MNINEVYDSLVAHWYGGGVTLQTDRDDNDNDDNDNDNDNDELISISSCPVFSERWYNAISEQLICINSTLRGEAQSRLVTVNDSYFPRHIKTMTYCTGLSEAGGLLEVTRGYQVSKQLETKKVVGDTKFCFTKFSDNKK